ncbi:MFS transporter [Streptomyces sp. URMC 126]|uniref:MFS transporter n=1 Tax=Streptomyces sp. URMC 126 TaxID=3423401 RepID=UPI003F1B45CA
MTRPTAEDRDGHRRAGPREWAGLVVLTLPVLLISIDVTVLGFAVPQLGEDLEPTGPQLLWIVDVYSFVLAGLLVTMGTLGDRIGRRKLLTMGCLGFGAASMMAAYAPDPSTLIAARALLGVAGATLMPSTLSLLRNLFHDEAQRLTALAAWGSAFSAGSALGPILGGWLLTHFWWGSVFAVNLPVAVVALVAIPMLLPESRDPAAGRLDLPSVALVMLATLPFVYGIKSLAARDAAVPAVGCMAFGVAAGYLFVRRQRALADPVIDVRLFGVRRFTGAVTANLMLMFAMGGTMFLLPQYVQLVLGLSPLAGGLLLLPGAVLSVAAGFVAAAAGRRVGPRRLVPVGLLLTAVGMAALALLDAGHATTVVVLAFAVLSLGIGAAMTLTNELVLAAVSPDRAGAASGVSETAVELGAAFGIALLGSLTSALYRSHLHRVDAIPDTGMDKAREALSDAAAVAHQTGGGAGHALLDSARDAFTTGLRTTGLAAGVLLAVAAVLITYMLRDPGTGDPAADG